MGVSDLQKAMLAFFRGQVQFSGESKRFSVEICAPLEAIPEDGDACGGTTSNFVFHRGGFPEGRGSLFE
jgi:hypothetical protein